MRKMPNFLSVIRSKIPRHFTQVLATLAVSLGPFAAGLGKGYSSPALASLQESKTSTFHVSAQEGSWIASLSFLGALFGCLFGGLMLQLGRKMSLLIVALPFSGSWLLTVFAQRVEMMYSTSFIGGFFSAVTLLATQVYVSEISHPEIRGCLSAVLKMAGHLGTLSSFALGAFLDWRQLATVAAGAPILFFLAILPIPETPSFLLYHGREEEACKSMAWLRSRGEDVASEIETLRSNIMTKQKSFLPRCSSQFPLRQLFITCGLMFFQKFSGVTVFFHYAVPIFRQVFGRSLNPHGAAIVVVFLQLLGSMTSGLLIDTAGRLPLLTLSNLFISGSFFGFGLYNWMEESLPPSHPGFGPSLDWIPLTCVLFFTLFFSIGIGPISWLMVGELFPLEYRGFGGAVSTSFSYACAFAAVKTYVDIHAHVGLYGAFWIYSGVSIAGLFFVCCVVPETKGVELEEMEHHAGCSGSVNATTTLNPSPGPLTTHSTTPINPQTTITPTATNLLNTTSHHPHNSPSMSSNIMPANIPNSPPIENHYPRKTPPMVHHPLLQQQQQHQQPQTYPQHPQQHNYHHQYQDYQPQVKSHHVAYEHNHPDISPPPYTSIFLGMNRISTNPIAQHYQQHEQDHNIIHHNPGILYRDNISPLPPHHHSSSSHSQNFSNLPHHHDHYHQHSSHPLPHHPLMSHHEQLPHRRLPSIPPISYCSSNIAYKTTGGSFRPKKGTAV